MCWIESLIYFCFKKDYKTDYYARSLLLWRWFNRLSYLQSVHIFPLCCWRCNFNSFSLSMYSFIHKNWIQIYLVNCTSPEKWIMLIFENTVRMLYETEMKASVFQWPTGWKTRFQHIGIKLKMIIQSLSLDILNICLHLRKSILHILL